MNDISWRGETFLLENNQESNYFVNVRNGKETGPDRSFFLNQISPKKANVLFRNNTRHGWYFVPYDFDFKFIVGICEFNNIFITFMAKNISILLACSRLSVSVDD